MAGDNISHNDSYENEGKQSELASMVSQLFKQEMGKYMKGKQQEEQVSYANQIDFAGNSNTDSVVDCYLPLECGSWILDTGASSHMCFEAKIMQHIQDITPAAKIHLPDSIKKLVSKRGQVRLHPKLLLARAVSVRSSSEKAFNSCYGKGPTSARKS